MAMENYDLADYQAAAGLLVQALDKAREAKMDKEILVARTHLLLGSVYINGMGDEARAVQEFVRALEIAPGITLEPLVDTAEARAALKKADIVLHPVVTCSNMRGIDHQQVTRADSGVALEIAFKVGAEVRSYKPTAELNYQIDEGTFTALEMTPRGDCEYAVQIPAESVSGESIQYYLSMKKPDGKTIAMRGNPRSPFLINVVQTERSPTVEVVEAKEEVPDELGFGSSKPKPRGAGCAGCAAGAATGNAAGTGLLVLLAGALVVSRRRRC